MSDTILELEKLCKRFGDIVPADEVDLAIRAGEFFTLLGPSGSGKSTILRIVAGLEEADGGRVRIKGEDMKGVPPWQRHIGMVFQQYANFPHLDVFGNVSYGLRRSRLSKGEIVERVFELLALVGLSGFERRRVTLLSGGEQQRVAIARALAPRPEMLLLDEPLSALDEKIRREMQGELRNIQQSIGTTFVYVTHDQEEALTMSDRIAVLNQGKVVQCDMPEQIFRHPRTRFVAQFFRGSNVLEAEVCRHGDTIEIEIAGVKTRTRAPDSTQNGRQAIAIRGERIRIAEATAGSDLVLTSRLEKITYRGLYSDYRLVLSDGQILSAAGPHRHDLRNGQVLEIGMSADDLILLQRD